MNIHFNSIKYLFASAAVAGITLSVNPCVAKNNFSQTPTKDIFVSSKIPPGGTQDAFVLKNAPSPKIKVCGEMKSAKIVVDLSKNILYHYDDNGLVQSAYPIASGRKSSPTHPGVRIVTHTETFPYRTAPKHTKRRRNPSAYGPKIICLNILDTKTGEKSEIGEFIHGNNDKSSIGKYVSKGCMRMDNDVIRYLSRIVKKGDIVIILPNKN